MKTDSSFLATAGKKVLSWIGLADANQKMRENAANWLELAEKVYNYRRDVLPAKEVAELQARTADLRALVKEGAGAEKLKLEIERLEPVLKQTGGAIYPKTALVENVEFFLVAALVILGIRTYFVQPFKIPTNSMWPTYNGMTPEAFVKPSDEPSPIARAFRFAAFGAFPRRIDAPASGEVMIPFDGYKVAYKDVPGRNWLIFPATNKEYTLFVGDSEVKVTAPADFDFSWAVRDAFFPSATSSHEPGYMDLRRVAARQTERTVVQINGSDYLLLKTGKHVKSGERVIAFDILTGDQLFVDRVSYHFIKPSVGSGFVFRTGNIPGIARSYGDQYYIKRLIGTPGDKIELKGYGLYRNGAPITGSEAFEKNARQEGNYVGYRQGGPGWTFQMVPGEQVEVPPSKYYAMGDNSANSADGREWGFVPAKDVVGRPILVYYPFTKHWGPAK